MPYLVDVLNTGLLQEEPLTGGGGVDGGGAAVGVLCADGDFVAVGEEAEGVALGVGVLCTADAFFLAPKAVTTGLGAKKLNIGCVPAAIALPVPSALPAPGSETTADGWSATAPVVVKLPPPEASSQIAASPPPVTVPASASSASDRGLRGCLAARPEPAEYPSR